MPARHATSAVCWLSLVVDSLFLICAYTHILLCLLRIGWSIEAATRTTSTLWSIHPVSGSKHQTTGPCTGYFVSEWDPEETSKFNSKVALSDENPGWVVWPFTNILELHLYNPGLLVLGTKQSLRWSSSCFRSCCCRGRKAYGAVQNGSHARSLEGDDSQAPKPRPMLLLPVVSLHPILSVSALPSRDLSLRFLLWTHHEHQWHYRSK